MSTLSTRPSAANTWGRVTAQRLQTTFINGDAPVVLDATYAWDNEGRITSRTYPDQSNLTYGYDIMGRLNAINGVSWQGGSLSVSAAFGPSGEMTDLYNGSYHETRTYNTLLQLTRQTVPGVMDLGCTYTHRYRI